jgi:hypothetical protein
MKFADALRGNAFPSEQRHAALWKAAHFCFDTSVLLNVYRYTSATRDEFLKLLAAIKDRIFVPHRVSVEFFNNRADVIREYFGPQRIIKDSLDAAMRKIRADHPKHPLLAEFDEIIAAGKKLVTDKYGKDEKAHLDLIHNDTILPQLLAAVGDEAGEPFDGKALREDYARRKANATPPFCPKDDKEKQGDEERQMGDLAVWLELLAKYEGTSTPLIFVTGDQKENWWHKVEGRHEPQPALVREAFERTRGEILLYTADRFSETAPGRLGVEVRKELAEETRELRKRERPTPQERFRAAFHQAADKERDLMRERTETRLRAKLETPEGREQLHALYYGRFEGVAGEPPDDETMIQRLLDGLDARAAWVDVQPDGRTRYVY